MCIWRPYSVEVSVNFKRFLLDILMLIKTFEPKLYSFGRIKKHWDVTDEPLNSRSDFKKISHKDKKWSNLSHLHINGSDWKFFSFYFPRKSDEKINPGENQIRVERLFAVHYISRSQPFWFHDLALKFLASFPYVAARLAYRSAT